MWRVLFSLYFLHVLIHYSFTVISFHWMCWVLCSAQQLICWMVSRYITTGDTLLQRHTIDHSMTDYLLNKLCIPQDLIRDRFQRKRLGMVFPKLFWQWERHLNQLYVNCTTSTQFAVKFAYLRSKIEKYFWEEGITPSPSPLFSLWSTDFMALASKAVLLLGIKATVMALINWYLTLVLTCALYMLKGKLDMFTRLVTTYCSCCSTTLQLCAMSNSDWWESISEQLTSVILSGLDYWQCSWSMLLTAV